jgi:hypothetical protein
MTIFRYGSSLCVVATHDLGLVNGVHSAGRRGGSQGCLDGHGIVVHAAFACALGKLDLAKGRVRSRQCCLNHNRIHRNRWGLNTLVDGQRSFLRCCTILCYAKEHNHNNDMTPQCQIMLGTRHQPSATDTTITKRHGTKAHNQNHTSLSSVCAYQEQFECQQHRQGWCRRA